MAVVANIEINGTAANDTDLPIDTLVQLSNGPSDPETTFLWEIVDQNPNGAADVLSATGIENPTFIPKKEGSYLIQLTVDQGLPTEVIDRKFAMIRELKSDQQLPAAQEDEERGARGWADANDPLVRFLLDQAADASVMTGIAGAALGVSDVVQVSDVTDIKVGLPGEEELPEFTVAPATLAANLEGLIGIVVGKVKGGGAASPGDLVFVRLAGLVATSFAGAPAVGDPVFVDDSAAVSLTAGTVIRKIGKVVLSGGGLFRVFFDGSITTSDAAKDYVHIETKSIGINSTTVTFSGLNGDADGFYVIRARFASVAVTDYEVRPNGVTTNQDSIFIFSAGGGVTDGLTTTLLLARTTGAAAQENFVKAEIDARTGLPRHLISAQAGVSTVARLRRISGVWDDSVTNITSLDIVSTIANEIRAGSEIELYKVRKG